MKDETLQSPVAFLKTQFETLPIENELRAYEAYWERAGKHISRAVDRAGTPPLDMFDRFGARIDEIGFAPEYWTLLKRGYREGVVWRIFEEQALLSSYQLGYITCFYDPGLYCPYTVSMSTAVPLSKYGADAVREKFLPPLLRRDDAVWQGATWMTEARGGSDLGANVETVARCVNGQWLLTGDKFFASNAGAELAVAAARPERAPQNVKGLALFLAPRYRADGSLNYHIRRLKPKVATRSVPTGEVELQDSEAYLLGKLEWGIYLILEVLNLSRIANSIGSVAVAQRALAEAICFTQQRVAFGKPLIEQPLMRAQIEQRVRDLHAASALAWYAARLLNEVWRETPPYSERYHLFRLVAHLAKYHTAEFAAQTAKWAMEVHGSAGVLDEFPVERLLRESMILAIWEGAPHRQILDGLEVMKRKNAHKLLFQTLAPRADPQALEDIAVRVEETLDLPQDEMEAKSENVFSALARFAGESLAH
ncbi:MAG: acyl-CoA dehydrogenase family protein [Chloroflexi bacterium]|nr:acyl-CoA dehydrogenase family protein [Chloroflexota bacterium]